jgi:tRNA modification GTPase
MVALLRSTNTGEVVPDTIVAVATPSGEGGIAVIRLSGPDSISIADRLFHGRRSLSDASSHTLSHGHLAFPDTDGITDEVLVAVMRAPKSYTCEDVVEINCHGGLRLAQEVVDACRAMGARRAERGEFTERAFLNGRLDLAQAEAVLEMVQARTGAGLSAACYQLTGGLSRRLAAVSGGITGALTRIEAGLEFPEEDVGVGDPRAEMEHARHALDEVNSLRATYERGRLISRGATVAITGPPNVGKSSLLNAILGHERAIVSPVPGTTRDIIEAEIDLDGLRVRLIDTAGLRATGDDVEREGTRRAERAAQEADVRVLVLDASGRIPSPDVLPPLEKGIIVMNKIDIGDEAVVSDVSGGVDATPICRTSALKDEGVDELCGIVRDVLLRDTAATSGDGVILSDRHAAALDECAESLQRVISEIEGQAREELVASDLRHTLDAIGRITGETTSEDILRGIFADFCIGK